MAFGLLVTFFPADTTQAETQPVALGTVEPFWRYSASLGPILERGYSLEEIPDYMLSGDFPYKKRPYPKEVPFADHLSIVRLLGGYQVNAGGKETGALDLVYRDHNGKLQYRMDLLKARLQPYLDQGYKSLTLVLDNIPWCLPKEPKPGSKFGQNVPPSDPQEWHDFIKELCLALKKIMGPDAENLRFRVGTENNAIVRFDGTQEQFLKHYDAAATAVKEVLPKAKFGAFNISSVNMNSLDHTHNVKAFELAEHCLKTPLSPTSSEHIQFDWVAYSRYYRPGEDIAASAKTCGEVWDAFEKRMPQLKGFSREIHEFGIAPFGEVDNGQLPSSEPGALGAALTCEMMWRLRAAGINRLWHWGMAEKFSGINGKKSELLFNGNAWVLSIMEQMVGGNAWLFDPMDHSPAKASYLMAGSFMKDRVLLMISATNTDISKHITETVRFHIPATLLRPGEIRSVRQVQLTQKTSVFDRIRVDLDMAGLLSKDFQSLPDRLGSVGREMGAGPKAVDFVSGRMNDYIKLWTDSLTLKPLDASIGKIQSDFTGTTITVKLMAPEVLVLDIR